MSDRDSNPKVTIGIALSIYEQKIHTELAKPTRTERERDYWRVRLDDIERARAFVDAGFRTPDEVDYDPATTRALRGFRQ